MSTTYKCLLIDEELSQDQVLRVIAVPSPTDTSIKIVIPDKNWDVSFDNYTSVCYLKLDLELLKQILDKDLIKDALGLNVGLEEKAKQFITKIMQERIQKQTSHN